MYTDTLLNINMVDSGKGIEKNGYVCSSDFISYVLGYYLLVLAFAAIMAYNEFAFRIV